MTMLQAVAFGAMLAWTPSLIILAASLWDVRELDGMESRLLRLANMVTSRMPTPSPDNCPIEAGLERRIRLSMRAGCRASVYAPSGYRSRRRLTENAPT